MLLLFIAAAFAGEFTDLVDPLIGSGGHGHVYVGANVPFGFIQLGPTTIRQEWDQCSGYHYDKKQIIAFQHTHFSGTGCGDLGDIGFLPIVGDVNHARGNEDDQNSGAWSSFSHENEKVTPGRYKVHLDRYDVDVDLTATSHVGFHKYTYGRAGGQKKVLIDLSNGVHDNSMPDTWIKRVSDTEIQGLRFSQGWINSQNVFFHAKFSKSFKASRIYENNDFKSDNEHHGDDVYAELDFDLDDGETLYVKVGISSTNEQNAKNNLEVELPGWDFETVAKAADEQWNNELSKIKITTNSNDVKKIFYTSLYHTMIAPSEYSDVNGDYRGSEDHHPTHTGNTSFKNYTTFSLWDTYRAQHPLLTIIHTDKMKDMIESFLHIYTEHKKLPVWHFMSCDTYCMVGNPGIPPVADAILKGIEGFDVNYAYESIARSAEEEDRGQKYFHQYGYIPFDLEGESVSKCLEYAIADYAVALVAKKLGKTEDYNHFLERSKAYKHYFDRATGFLRPKHSNGSVPDNWNPCDCANYWTEANGWQTLFLVPHDVEGLADLYDNGADGLLQKLDELFQNPGCQLSNCPPDVAGLIGMYAHGNEPNHHIPYMYTILNKPWRAAEELSYIMKDLYKNDHDGLAGNEDVGQMSAWYVLSALGFYQVEPAGGKHIFGTPVVDGAEVKVKDGKVFKVVVHDLSDSNIYIERIELNGKEHKENSIDYQQIMAGGELHYYMTNKSGIKWW